MDGRGRYLDNIFIERLWRSLKQEAVYLHEITDGFQAKRIIDTWIGFYNSERPHTALDKRTPDIAYFGQAETRKAAWTHTRCILAKPQTCPKKQDHFTQRELKSLNATKANIAAFANSNSNSKIAAIALYKESAIETVAASNQYDTVSLNLESSLNVWRETKEQLDSLVNNYTGRLADDIKADLDALDPDSETYQADLASLEEEKTTYNAFVLSNNTLAGIVNEDVATVEANRVSLSTAEQQY